MKVFTINDARVTQKDIDDTKVMISLERERLSLLEDMCVLMQSALDKYGREE